ncbi:dethiobiotin synthase [Pokkaliibacter sp. CJK22405]|uniref:dethiobiotin synthase n=1 Tax=Pokkaliibacter sp. CJK22405 TaxID=3384615 RepID=UPI003984F1FB
MATFFVTGTDTDAGKTLIGQTLLFMARQQGLSTLGIKPIASGSVETESGLRNSDALALQRQSDPVLAYELHNPVCFKPAIAPHIAAVEAGLTLSLAGVSEALSSSLIHEADFRLIEGAGGWFLPLNDQGESLSQWVISKKWPVILVIGVKLGCLNHARLTREALLSAGVTIAGWVANTVDKEMPYQQENLRTLHTLLPEPCLGEVPFLASADPETASAYLSLAPLLSSFVG